MTLVREFWQQTLVDSTVTMDKSLRAFARETYQFAEKHAPTSGPAPSTDRRSGVYPTSGRGVSGESVN